MLHLPAFQVDFDVKKSIVLLGLAGSHSYGTNGPTSDIDYRGIFIPPIEYYLDPFLNIEQLIWRSKDGIDYVQERSAEIANVDQEGTIFALRKFIGLAAKCNPNVIETLFIDDSHVEITTPIGEALRARRDLFLSQRAGKSFCGYAMSQLRRIETHRRWIANPPDHEPTRDEYSLPPIDKINPDQKNAAEAFIRRNMLVMAPWLLDADNQHKEAFWEGVINLIALYLEDPEMEFQEARDNWMLIEANFAERTTAKLSFDSNFMEFLRNEKKWAQARSDWDKYHHWLRTRNPARAEIEARYGYDCKHAMHLVRLLRMGTEILTQGKLIVYRPDREELIQIRNGSWPYDELVEWAKAGVDNIYGLIREKKTVVPKDPDQAALETLNREIVEQYYKFNYSDTR